ncbi:MAG: aminotransferase class I/II-fold pyridoxal phosphate-dependent enzyme [Pseudomonadota bacterium]
MFQTLSPFERLREQLKPISPGAAPIDLTVGSPQHAPPAFVSEALAANAGAVMAYPPIGGTADLQAAITDWVAARYRLPADFAAKCAVLPTSGSREGLFFAAITARDTVKKEGGALLFANPFYQTYPAAAHALGLTPIPIAAHGSAIGNLEALPAKTLSRAVAYYVGSPSNPEGHAATIAEWHALFEVALANDIFVFADECYSEIYREAAGPPTGALEAAALMPEILPRLFVFNSLSKRSNLAGLRAGFVAGARAEITAMRNFRNQAAPQVPWPVQAAAAAAFRDETHVVENRRLYDAKYSDAREILGPIFGDIVPDGGFFLWLPVGGDDVSVAQSLWSSAGVRVVPGSYLALTRAGQNNPGRGYVRLALVADRVVTREALSRVRECVERGQTGERPASQILRRSS